MWDTSGFGDSTNSAGGFFNAPNQFDSPSSNKTKGGQARRHQNVLPVVIRQIRECKEEDFKMFGMSAQIVVVVGILREYEVQSTKATYEIEDHTGRITAIWWLENDSGNCAPNLPLVKEGSYVRVFGSLRSQEGRKMIMVLKMFPVDNINIVTSHLLQVIHSRLEAEALSKGSNMNQLKANNPGAELANSMSFMNDDTSSAHTGLNPMQEKVYRILQPIDSPAGLSRQAILQHFAPNQQREVNNALEFLVNEGHAYSTIDNDHFKVTDSF